MADSETEKEWEKLRRIEAERQKAVDALKVDEEKELKRNQAYLAMGAVKPRGYVKDPVVIMNHAERIANVAVILVVLMVVMGVLNFAGSVVSMSFKLGLAGAFLAIPGVIAMICEVVAGFLAGLALTITIIHGRKTSHKVKNVVITSLICLVVIVLYVAGSAFLMNLG